MENEKFQELVLQQLQALTEGQKQFTEEQKQLSQGLKQLTEEQKELSQGQKQLTEEQKELSQGLKQLTEEQKELSQGQKQLTEGQKELSQGQKQLTEGQNEIRKDLTKLETRMENEIIDKVRALFDANSVHMDYFASIRNSQAKIEETLDILMHHLIKQDQKLYQHEREIRLLRVEKNQQT